VTLQFPTIKKRQEGIFLGRGEERDREIVYLGRAKVISD